MFEFKNNESYTFGNFQFVFFDDLKKCVVINLNTNLSEEPIKFNDVPTQEMIHKRINQFFSKKVAYTENRLSQLNSSLEQYQRASQYKLCDIVLVVVEYANQFCIEIRRLPHGGDMEKRFTELYSHAKVLKTYRLNGLETSAEEELFRRLVSRLKQSDVVRFDANNYRVVIDGIYFGILDTLGNIALSMSKGNLEIETCKEC